MPQTNEPGTIMVVDDTPANLQLLEAMLVGNRYRLQSFPRAGLALKAAEKNPPDLILLDINMPEMNGYDLCLRLKEDPRLRDIPVIFISGLNEANDKLRAFEAGGVDYVTKPFHLEEVQARVNTHLKIRRLQKELEECNRELEARVLAQVQEISSSQMATIFALAKLAESRDDQTGKHIERVQLYCKILASKLAERSPYADQVTPAFVDNIYLASPLHDIGKVAIQDDVLLKPAKLTSDEFEIMKKHTVIGAKTLATALAKYPHNIFLRTGLTIARSHHERWDGTGYPDGASGTEIPLYARIMALADVYDALRSDRCYRAAVSHKETCATIRDDSGAHFDPVIVEAFTQIADDFEQISNTVTAE